MKKIFSLLMLALLTMSAWAETTVTFDLTTGFSDTEELTTVSQGVVTLTFDKGGSSTTPKWYNNGTSARLYAKNTLNIASTGDNITMVTFTFTSTGYTMNNNGACSVNAGTYVENGTTGTWTGNAKDFTITRGGTNGHARISSIVVVMGGEVVTIVADPVFTPADGATFNDTQEISLTCTTGGATISYNTDGQTWKTYNEPFTIEETTTVQAKAALNGVESNVVSATYTKLEPVSGSCITFKSSEDKGNGTATQNPWTVEKNGVTMDCSKGWVDDNSYRIYQNETLTFTSTVGNIVKIEFDGVNSYPISRLSTPTGTLTTNGNNGIWIGQATEVVFTASAQTRASEIRVYVDGELPTVTIAAPTIPASQEFEESISVQITNNEEGATVMYAINDGEFTAYNNETLTFTETTTLKAKAVKDNNESSVVTATYTKVEPTPVYTTLAQVNELGTGTEFVFNGNAVVTAQKRNYMWLRDESGYGLIYGNINGQSNVTFNAGTVLNQGWTAKTSIFSGLMEYQNAQNVSASDVTNPTLAAIQTITKLDTTMVNAYVQVLNVKSFAVENRNVTATMLDGTTMVMYNTFDEAIPTEEGNYTVEGAVSTHNGMQLIILSIQGFVPEVPMVNSIAEVYDGINPGTTFNMMDDVVVTYHNADSKRLFIRDSEGTSGLIYGDLEGNPTFNNGDVLSDDWTATFTVYQQTPEFTNAQGISASGDTREANPYERNAEEIEIENVNEYIILKNQTVLPDNTNGSNSENRYFIDLPNDSLVLFNQFGLELPTIEDGKTYDVTGLVTVYRGKAQVYIVNMTEVAPAFIRGDVDMDGFVKISDVTALINYLLSNDATGIDLNAADTDQDMFIKISDVTTLINYLLSGSW